jgi:hypothetical protein
MEVGVAEWYCEYAGIGRSGLNMCGLVVVGVSLISRLSYSRIGRQWTSIQLAWMLNSRSMYGYMHVSACQF